MRKVKLQMQQTANGFVGGPNGELDWMEWNWTDDIKKCVNELTDSSDTILLGRKMTDGFVTHWENVKPEDEEYPFARKMVDTPKVVFSKTLEKSLWNNTTLAKGNLGDEINALKNQKGKDIVVYGGAGFVSSLIEEGLIDELNLFVNPSTIPEGLIIFKKRTNLKLTGSQSFQCGIILLQYVPVKN